MVNIFDKIKKNYKLIIPIVAIIVLIIAGFYFYREYRYNNYRNKEKKNVYQYLSSVRVDYDLILTKNLKNIIIDIKSENKNIYFDSTPVYFKDSNKVLFPLEMNVVFPLKEAMQYRTYKYATCELNDSEYYLVNGNKKGKLTHFFLYDGANLFFFPYESILKIGNKEDIKLSSMSFAEMVTDTLIYYDKDNDASKMINLNGENVIVNTDGYDINIREKNFIRLGGKVQLFSPSYLNSIDEVIDK